MPELCYQHLCALAESINLSWGEGGECGWGSRARPFYFQSLYSTCVSSSLSLWVSSILFCCQSRSHPPLFTSFLFASYLSFSLTTPPLNLPRPESHPCFPMGNQYVRLSKRTLSFSLTLSLFAYSHTQSHTY